MADMDLQVILRLVDKLSEPMKRATGQIRHMQTRINETSKAMASVGKKMTTAVTLPIAGAGAASVKVAADFQEAMLEWKKAADELSTPKAFQEAQNQILKLATALPLTQTELASLASAASRAGIPFKEVAGTVELAAKAADAFGIPIEEAGKSIFSIADSAKLGSKELNLLLGQFDLLENSMNVRGSELVDITTRIGALGRQAGFTNQEVAAIGATMVASGIGAERASMAIKNLTKQLIAGESLSKEQQDLMQRLGFDPDNFAKSMQEDAIGTLDKLRQSILKLPDHRQTAALFELFDSQAAPAIAQLFNNWENLQGAIELTNDKTAAAEQLQKSFLTTMEGMNKQMSLLRNAISNVAIALGTGFLPKITDAIKGISNWVAELSKAPDHIKALTAGFVALAAAGPGLVILGAALPAVANGLAAIKAAGLFFTGPVGLAIAGLGATALLIANNWDTVGPAFERVGNAAGKLLEHFRPIADAIKSIGESVGIVSFDGFFDGINEKFASTIAGVLNNVAVGLERIHDAVAAIKNLSVGSALKNILGGLNALSPRGILNSTFGVGEAVDQALTPDLSKAGKGPARGIAAMNSAARGVSAVKSQNRGMRDFRRGLTKPTRNLVDSNAIASLAAGKPATGAPMPVGMNINANGPEVHVTQQPPAITNIANVYVQSADQAPNATADAIARSMSGLMNDGVNE